MSTEATGLRELAGKRGLRIGTAVSADALRDDPQYRTILAREFDMITCENAMKFGPLRPERDRFAFDDADAIVAFAREHGMAVRGHTLVWHYILPDWFAKGGFTYDDGIDLVRGHIHTVVSRYRGDVFAWDVVNEALDDHGGWRDSPFLRMFGPDYLAMAFHWAHEADPDAKLFYNDYSADGLNRKSDAMYAMIRMLLEQGAPIHGVGLQMHLCVWDDLHPASIAANIKRFNDLGLDVHITEMDVRIKEPFLESDLLRQARIYREIMDVCLRAERCGAWAVWGVTDRYSWVPQAFKREGAALLFDDAGQPKPAYEAVRDALVS
ncbi:MAG TPA: endo-1,4-beta-xylanase [Candidatus Hydrogenedentes bacterium]|nr:endo-1,4-beta-xylanase [Candidatus Hydrogenedentota bacterium]HOV74909.1 endo-1,4-beta-xylanase [Candidatus Hydrogenedentota bacterium]HPC17529.1 endo-1,4-beta-xylanase [Candidatus Hydrogenedentota bacterium]HRT20630.1 endo-1,4-beta-xylanase [Candidatus Hydrogenedentota bacterium]HRT65363.1 endo-1,4-beta-xylanase [Candidatus Hydrogenedentota bacterium]